MDIDRLAKIGYKARVINYAMIPDLERRYRENDTGITVDSDKHVVYGDDPAVIMNKVMEIIDNRCGIFNKYDGVVSIGLFTWPRNSADVKESDLKSKSSLESFCSSRALGYIDCRNQYVNYMSVVPDNYIRIVNRDYVGLKFDDSGVLTIFTHRLIKPQTERPSDIDVDAIIYHV